MNKRLLIAAVAFGVLAIVAGVLQVWAFVVSDQPRHLVVGIFALSIGICVTVGTVRAVLKRGSS